MVSNLGMKDMQREILSQVASGTITAAEGASRLESLHTPETGPPPSAPEPAPAAGKAVKVVSHLGSATIVGDPTVAFAVADGPHRVRQDGDTLVIDIGLLGQDDGFSFGPASRLVSGLGRSRDSLTVRMNPELALITTLRAGDVRIVGVHGPITAEVTAGDCKIEDFRSTLNAVVQAGSFSAGGRLAGGVSKIRCQMGEVRLNLEKGSDVRISAHTTLGSVSIDGRGVRAAEPGREVTVGAGAGTLDLVCTMGDIKVNVD